MESWSVKPPTYVIYQERVYTFLRFCQCHKPPMHTTDDVDAALVTYFDDCFGCNDHCSVGKQTLAGWCLLW